VWQESLHGPLLLIAGGSGFVPFRAMLRHWEAVGGETRVRVLYSARSLDEVLYRDELLALASDDEVDVRLALTRAWPGRLAGSSRAHKPGAPSRGVMAAR
jgi:2-polyprenylphenol hydroxylase and related flavodoxin oxidoreductases